MENILLIYKPVGRTPLQVIEKVKEKNPIYKDQKIGYAGRLDPMAEGLLLLLVGEETKQREKYQKLDKEYEFEALLGVSTDSYDILGLLNELEIKEIPPNLEEKIQNFLNSKIGKWRQKYPVFSAKAVKGKKLFEWAKERKLAEIEIPEKQIEVYSFEKLSERTISSKNLREHIFKNIDKIQGDFRQNDTKKRWGVLFDRYSDYNFKVIKFKAKCSSGTYIRGIVDDLGKFLGCSSLALTINRIKVGDYSL